MNELLKDYKTIEVENYIKYIESLKTSKDKYGNLRNKWAPFVKDEEYARLFKQAKSYGLLLDGDSITIENKGQVKLNFNYQAYKNLLLLKYPEAKIDCQLVFEGDNFTFKKVNGTVEYTHEICNPFKTDKKIIGVYCIIKTKQGENIEILNEEDINLCRSKATTQAIWNEWFGEMVLKTAIKRACKRYYKNIVKDIDDIDNEDYDLSKTYDKNENYEMITEEQIKQIDELGIDKQKACEFEKVQSLKDLTKKQAQKIINLKINSINKSKKNADI